MQLTQTPTPNLLERSQFLINALSGGVAGSIAKTVSAPLERVKILLQTAKQNIKFQTAQQTTGGLQCLSYVLKNEGVFALWRGNFINVARYFPTQALNFGFKEQTAKIFNVKNNNNKNNQNQNQLVLAMKLIASGGSAGVLSNLFVYPLDFARTMISVDMGQSKQNRQFKGLFDCISRVLKVEGVRGLYKGFSINISGIFIYRGAYFGLYDFGKQQKDIKQFQSQGLWAKFAFAQFVTILSGTLSYPQDTIKRKMMMQTTNAQLKYKNTWDCIRAINQSEGFAGYFRGNLSNCLRCISGASCLVLFDVFQNKFDDKKNH